MTTSFINININGLTLSSHPSAEHIMIKYFDNIEFDDEFIGQYYAINSSNMYIAFVNPTELSYHNLENILNLDLNFQKNNLNYSINSISKYENMDVYKFDLLGSTDILLKLDELKLYTTPFNNDFRGGKRFIFSSKILANKLTSIIKLSDFSSNVKRNFSHVNFVFRYNKFEPDDNKFMNHYDTPYYDSKLKQCSKYTLLIYLTPGTANPVLQIEDLKINNIKAFNGFIFNQKYNHEGSAFATTNKIFIRSELIYNCNDLDHDLTAAKLFNISCYMTKQITFNPELKAQIL